MFLNGEKRGECGFLGAGFEFEGLRVLESERFWV